MRAVIATEYTQVGAAETYLFSLAGQLARTGDEVELWVYPQIHEEAARWVSGSGVRLIQMPEATRARLSFAFKRLRSLRPGIVHANQGVSPVLIAALAARVPGRFVTDHVLPKRPQFGWRGRVLRRLTMASAREVVVFSQQNARLASGSWERTPVRVIYPGVPEPHCRKSARVARADLGLPADAIVVTSVGRLTEQKRMDVLVKALSRVGDRRVVGLVVGDGPDRRDLEGLVGSPGASARIDLTGHRADVGCILRATDIYVQCSAWEGICFAVLEAMASGLPCVTTEVPALREAVGDTGLPAVAVGAVDELAHAIRALADDDARRTALAHALRARWERSFTVERMAEDHRAAYLTFSRSP